MFRRQYQRLDCGNTDCTGSTDVALVVRPGRTDVTYGGTRDDNAGTTPLLLALQERQIEIFR